MLGAAASIFFAYVGFDAVSTAAEETKNPQRNVPIGLIGSLLICTVFYLLVAGGVIGAFGAQPLIDPRRQVLRRGLARALRQRRLHTRAHAPLVCSKEALAYVLREVGHPMLGNIVGLAATIALPSVVLLMMYGQTRIFFVMARDGLLPPELADGAPEVQDAAGSSPSSPASSWRSPPPSCRSGQLADYSNSGTLFAFAAVSLGVMILRFTDKTGCGRSARPLLFVVAPLSIIGCVVLFFSLNGESKVLFAVWAAIGLVFYFPYGYRKQPCRPRHRRRAGARRRRAGGPGRLDARRAGADHARGAQLTGAAWQGARRRPSPSKASTMSSSSSATWRGRHALLLRRAKFERHGRKAECRRGWQARCDARRFADRSRRQRPESRGRLGEAAGRLAAVQSGPCLRRHRCVGLKRRCDVPSSTGLCHECQRIVE